MEKLPRVPSSLLNRTFDLPVEAQEVHSREPETLAIHRILGFKGGQDYNRQVVFVKHRDGDVVARCLAGTSMLEHTVRDPAHVLAAASYLEGFNTFKRVLAPYPASIRKAFNTEVEAQLKIWHGVGLIPMSHDGSEFAFVRKDELHPVPGYCQRLAMIGGGMDPHEVLLWNEEERSTVGMAREIYEEIARIDIADELITQMQDGGEHTAKCFLYMWDGKPTVGKAHIFVSQARDAEEWARWRRIFTKEEDGIGEARPALITRDELIAAFMQERTAVQAREQYLSEHTDQTVTEAAEPVHKRFKRDWKTQTDADWLALRQEGQRTGTFPTKDRGDFAFIAGHGDAIEKALKRVGINLAI